MRQRGRVRRAAQGETTAFVRPPATLEAIGERVEVALDVLGADGVEGATQSGL